MKICFSSTPAKVGLTAEVYGASKEVDVCVVGTVSHEGESQQWTLEDGRLKTNLSDDTSGDLVMEIVENDKVKIRLRNEGNADQLFHLVPVDLINGLIFMHENRNALTEANFLKKNLR